MTIFLLLLLGLPLRPDSSPQVPTTPAPLGPQDGGDQRDPEQAFEELRGQYQAALDAHSHTLRRLHQERVPEDTWPPHPALEWHARFERLASEGSGRADLWILQNLAVLHPERPRQGELAMRSLRRLVEQHSDAPYMVDVFEYAVRRRALIGREASLELVSRLVEESSSPEIVARALYEKALLVSDRLTSEDPEVMRYALGLLRTAVDGYPGTEGAKFAASPLFNRSVARLWVEIVEWTEAVRALAAQGVPWRQWPTFPLHNVWPEILACSQSDHPSADEWVNVFFPAFEQAGRRSFEDGLFEFTRAFYRRAPAIAGPSVDARFALWHLLTELWPDEPFMMGMAELLTAGAGDFPLERYRPLVDLITAKTSREDVRHQAWLALAQNLMRSNREAEISEALTLLTKLGQEAPIESVREIASEARRTLEVLMPGYPAPGFSVNDSEGFQLTGELYRGRVLLLVFWSLSDRQSTEALPAFNRLHAQFEGRPFNVVGMNTDLITPAEFRKRASEHGIAWRNALLGARSPLLRTYGARMLPMTVLIDAEGVIRARGLMLEGAAERIEPFVRRAEERAREGTER